MDGTAGRRPASGPAGRPTSGQPAGLQHAAWLAGRLARRLAGRGKMQCSKKKLHCSFSEKLRATQKLQCSFLKITTQKHKTPKLHCSFLKKTAVQRPRAAAHFLRRSDRALQCIFEMAWRNPPLYEVCKACEALVSLPPSPLSLGAVLGVGRRGRMTGGQKFEGTWARGAEGGTDGGGMGRTGPASGREILAALMGFEFGARNHQGKSADSRLPRDFIAGLVAPRRQNTAPIGATRSQPKVD